jgi:hypothetical protein
MRLFGTSFHLDLGNLRLQWSIALDDRGDIAYTRVEDLPKLELTKRD